MKGKEIVKGIRDESVKRPQRVVIDEELPDNRFRILVANMKSRAEEPDLMSRGTWGKETERVLKKARLGELLSKKQMREVREGQVFFIRKKRSKNVHEDAREHVKDSVKVLLEREGRAPGRRRSDE